MGVTTFGPELTDKYCANAKLVRAATEEEAVPHPDGPQQVLRHRLRLLLPPPLESRPAVRRLL